MKNRKKSKGFRGKKRWKIRERKIDKIKESRMKQTTRHGARLKDVFPGRDSILVG